MNKSDSDIPGDIDIQQAQADDSTNKRTELIHEERESQEETPLDQTKIIPDDIIRTTNELQIVDIESSCIDSPNTKSIDSKGRFGSDKPLLLKSTEDDEDEEGCQKSFPLTEFTKSPVKDSALNDSEEMWPFISPIPSKAERGEASFDVSLDDTDTAFALPLDEMKITQLESTEYELEPENPNLEVRNGGAASSPPRRNAPTRRNTSQQLIKHLNNRNESLSDDDEKMSPTLMRRLRDFSFAQQKRRETYGEKNPWGIIGLYDHLTGIRTDIEWAEDAAWRRENNEPYLSWSDFEGAKNTGFNQPFFTYFVMLVCTACLIWSIRVNNWKVEPLSVNPMIGPSAETLIKVGAKQTSLIVQENEWWRLLSPMVLHAGIIHFVLNMVALWFIGYAVEMNHGFIAIAILFIVPAIGGTLLSALFLPEYISVGASGGIFGLIGACIADITTNWNLLFSKEVNISNDGQRFRNVKVLVWLLVDILLNVLIGLTPFVDNFTHLGGMVYGFLCALTKLERLSKAFFGVKKGLISKIQHSLVRLFGTILSIALIVITFFVLIRSDGKKTPCQGCRYVSCVPFPFWAEYEDKWWYCDDCENIEVEVRQSTETNVYSSMNITCPDGEITFVDLSVDAISDKAFLQRRLPKYCRANCDSIFAN